METILRVAVVYVFVMVGLRVVTFSTLLLLAAVTEVFTYRFLRIGRILNGSPVTLVSHGRLRPVVPWEGWAPGGAQSQGGGT